MVTQLALISISTSSSMKLIRYKNQNESNITFHQVCDEQLGTQMDVCTEGR